MKISQNWLETHIKTPLTAEEISDLLTELGLEVEKVSQKGGDDGSLEGVVIGDVLTCAPHPNADRLRYTSVNIGTDAPVQIVCGAPNIAAGQKVAVATVGTILGTGDQRFKIKKSKIRGIESVGMICSEQELGLGQDGEGIMVLDTEAAPGTPLTNVLSLKPEVVYEIGITPNRSDALSHFGVARDLRAGLIQRNKPFEFNDPSTNFNADIDSLKTPDISITHPEVVTRYCAVQIDGIKVGPSPDWLKERLGAIGLTSNNNVVDALNYIMFDLGQPLHAFDVNTLTSTLKVGHINKETTLTTLDNVKRTLSEQDIVIYNDQQPLCLAGVYGGLDSGVSASTTSILIESAVFDAKKIRRSAKRHGLSTDASFRFEREVDPKTTLDYLKQAINLVIELAGGQISSNIFDFYPTPKPPHKVSLSLSRLNDFVGVTLEQTIIERILSSLEISFKSGDQDTLLLEAPTYRADVLREVDVFEEILRVYGYNNIQTDKHIEVPLNVKADPNALFFVKNRISSYLVSLGLHEIMTNSLTKETHADPNAVKILNPLSNELAVMRTSLIPAGLEAIAHNIRHQEKNIQFFEFGKTYSLTDAKYQERDVLSIFVTGTAHSNHWHRKEETVDVFYLKGLLVSLLSRLGISFYKVTQQDSQTLTLSIGRDALASVTSVTKQLCASAGIKEDVYSCIVNLDVLMKAIPKKRSKVKPINKFPSVKRDLSMVLDDSVTFQQITDIAKQAEKEQLQEVSIFDVYTGEHIPKGQKSYAVNFLLQHKQKTLQEQEIDKIMHKIQSALEKQLGATIRES